MNIKRSNSIDYTSQCTVCIDYEDGGAQNRIIYQRPQYQLPSSALTELDLVQLSRYPDDDALTREAGVIFSDLQSKERVGSGAVLKSIFVARNAASALEMGL